MLDIRPLTNKDRSWVRQKTCQEWGTETVVAHGEIFHPDRLPGFCASRGKETLGLITYQVCAAGCEIVTLNSWQEGLGIGTALIEAVEQAARGQGCRRLWLVTTNDNTTALRFYQKRGFVLCALRVAVIQASRQLKPQIPLLGVDGIPIRDELELEMWL
jgi:ribosomal protein S18 acetylase RimI-like enzyme